MPLELRKWLASYLLFAAISGGTASFLSRSRSNRSSPSRFHSRELRLGRPHSLSFSSLQARGCPRIASYGATLQLRRFFNRHFLSLSTDMAFSTFPPCLPPFGMRRHRYARCFALWPFGQKRRLCAKVSGLLLGFVGAMIVLGIWRPISGGDLLGSLACFGAAVCYGIANAYVVRFIIDRDEPLVVLATGQLIAGGVQLALIMALFGMPLVNVDVPTATWACLLALGTLGTGVA